MPPVLLLPYCHFYRCHLRQLPFPFCPPEDMPPDSLISRWSLFAADRAAAPLWMGHFKLNSSPPHGCSLQRQAPVASCPSFAVKACFFEVLCSLHSHCKSAQQTRIVRLFEENAAVNATTTSAADATAPVAAATAHPVDWPHHTDYRAMSQLVYSDSLLPIPTRLLLGPSDVTPFKGRRHRKIWWALRPVLRRSDTFPHV